MSEGQKEVINLSPKSISYTSDLYLPNQYVILSVWTIAFQKSYHTQNILLTAEKVYTGDI